MGNRILEGVPVEISGALQGTLGVLEEVSAITEEVSL